MGHERTVSELDEIVLRIFFHLDAFEVIKCSTVSKRWYRVANDNSLWQNLVLKRWPSQNSVLSQVTTLALQWQRLYKYLLGIGNYSPDDMKYFIICKINESILAAPELQQAMFNVMKDVNKNWEKPRFFELEETSPRFFNSNMELYYDTHDLKWVFIDRRREYVDDSFTIRLNQDRMASRQMRFIRPYQVMASCIMMYRWLVLFQNILMEDVGLAFYRIWRFRLKHLETGFIFETYDWKAAMSSTFSHGCPVSMKFCNDGLAILDTLSSPFFVNHPQGSSYKVTYELSFPVYSESLLSSDNISRSSSIEMMESVKLESKSGEMPATTKDDEFVSHNSNLKSPVRKSFASVSDTSPLPIVRKLDETTGVSNSKDLAQSSDTTSNNSGRSGNDDDQESEDNGDDYGYYCNCEYFIHRSSWEYEEQQMIQAEAATKWQSVHESSSVPTFELIFDSYEEKWLFCLHNDKTLEAPERLNRQMIEKSLEEGKIICDSTENDPASLERVESATSDVVPEVIVSSCVKSNKIPLTTTKENFSSTNSDSTPEIEQCNGFNVGQDAIPSSLTLYRLICLFDLPSHEYKSSQECCVWSVNLQHRFSRGVLQLKDLNGWLRVFAKLNNELRLYCSDATLLSLNRNLEYHDEKAPSCSGAKTKGESSSSDNHSEVSSDASSEDEFSNPLEKFKRDICSLLQLLVSQKFAHPYGTVAGAVA